MNLLHIARWVLGNLFLAWLPVALAFPLARGLRRDLAGGHVRWLRWLPLLLLWLVFLPNTCYLLTEWRHYLAVVNANPEYSLIYRYGQYPPGTTMLLLILTASFWVYSALGLVALCVAVRPLDCLASRYWSKAGVRYAQGLLFLLCSVGTYLGLVDRFNSWDILRTHAAPALLQSIRGLGERPLLLVLLLAFAAMLWLLYALFDIWVEGALARVRAARARHSEAGVPRLPA